MVFLAGSRNSISGELLEARVGIHTGSKRRNEDGVQHNFYKRKTVVDNTKVCCKNGEWENSHTPNQHERRVVPEEGPSEKNWDGVVK